MTWGFLIANRAKRQLRRLSADERDYIDSAFKEMRDAPYDGDIKFLKGTGGKSWPRKSAQEDRWNFCLTAGTLCAANQERP